MNKKYDHIIIDTNLLYYKNYSTHEDLTYEVKGKKIVTGGIYGSIISIKKLIRDFLGEYGTVWCVFDNATSKQNMRQRMIDPTYKVSRKKRSKPFYRSLDYLRLILMNYDSNIKVIYGTGFEADDLVPNILKEISFNDSILLVSEDLDWSRLIEYNKRPIHQFMKKQVFDGIKFNNKYNFFPTNNKVSMYKAIKGDKSDDIPIGIPRVPTKKVIELIEAYKDIYDLIENIRYTNILTDKWKKDFSDNRSRLRLNYQLVSFIPVDQSYFKQFVTKGKYRPSYLKRLYESLGFKIRTFDSRVFDYILKQKFISEHYKYQDDFFRPPKIKRR